MKTEAKTSRWNLKKVAMALALGVTVAGATAAPAMAADWRHDGYDRHGRYDNHRPYHHVYRPHVYNNAYRAPYAYTPPAYYSGYSFPSLSFVIPLR